MLHRLIKATAAATVLALSAMAPSFAAVLQIDAATGALLGARNVAIGASEFNVTFVDGDCPTLFSGCDSNSDFDFAASSITVLDVAAALRDHAVSRGMMPLRDAALAKLVRGVTTFEEIIRVTGI